MRRYVRFPPASPSTALLPSLPSLHTPADKLRQYESMPAGAAAAGGEQQKQSDAAALASAAPAVEDVGPAAGVAGVTVERAA